MYRFSFIIFCIAASDAQTPNFNASSLAIGQPEKLARSFGYVADSHNVTTTDGYILTVFRIRNASISDRNSKPIVLQHGMGSNAGQWVLLGTQYSLAFILADKGFDVWLSNTRGSVHSRKHKTLSSDSTEFWDFSWHEHGVFDMPAIIDFILNSTSHRKLYYVGHSMGGTTFYVMSSMRPEYNKKVRLMFGLAPAGYMSNSRLSFAYTPARIGSVQALGKTLFKNRFESEFILEKMTKSSLCKALQYECGHSAAIPFPDFVSVGQCLHYAQLSFLPFTFRMYDYGTEINMAKYHVPEPPRYPIERIITPMTLMYSIGDNVVGSKDVEKFAKDVPNAQLYYILDPTFGHFDFVTSPLAKNLLYDPMIKQIIEFQTQDTK